MLERVRQITQEVNRAENTQQALEAVVLRVCESLGSEVCSVYLADYDHQRLTLMASKGLNPKVVGQLQLDFHQGIVGLVAQREEPINLDDAPNHPNFEPVEDASEEAYQSLLGAPIIHQRRVLGVLVVQQKQRRKFSEPEVNFLVTLSAQLASVIARSESRDQITAPVSDPHAIRKLKGFPAASGIAIGEAMVFYPPADLSGIPDKPAKSISAELKRIKKAFQLAQAEVIALKSRMENTLGSEELSLFDAYLNILNDNGLKRDVIAEIEEGHWAPAALRRAVDQHIRVFETMEDTYFRERSSDLKDLARRVLVYLEDDRTARPKLTKASILVAEEITAAMLAELPTEKILGMVSMRGSPTSHAAILAKALGIPSVSGFDNVPINNFEGKELIVDGYKGLLFLSPSEGLKHQYEHLIIEERQLTQELERYTSKPAKTIDGKVIPLLVNTGLMADFEKSLHVGADGVGLYRTEIPFLLREQFPGEEEQTRIYRSALEAFKGKSVTFRTLDIGGDKQLPYFPIVEDNPFLGWRGIRITLDHPEIFLVQARAIFKASRDFPDIRISLPMVSSVDEVDEAMRLLEQALYEVNHELGGVPREMPEVGIILEVPSAIYQIAQIAKRVNFLSVGSNDLAQYLLAVDRNNTRVSTLYSYYHPALITVLDLIAKECSEQKIRFNICGEMAGDPMAAVLLLGMGYQGLSMNARSILKIKKIIRHFDSAEAKQLVAHVLSLEKAKDVHTFLFEVLENKGLGGLIRAGK
ncbi:phosphoenolpyruvate--protein phosphotransferase [Pleionea sediminis]|uniref:phosphoenolpyruvate--protein phosphotransferase n=1 Tax=Pleionea sediminis TaxID=2569479 RepID=UPI001186CF2A|nr:phosphoenolpyruvate--protein phosphotransferase [Pleionea sediminis]